MRYLLSILLMLPIITGCSSETNHQGSVAATVNINGEWYDFIGVENPDKYTIDKKLGEVIKKVNPQKTGPIRHLESNYLEAGTLLFSSKESKNIILAQMSKGNYEIFEKR